MQLYLARFQNKPNHQHKPTYRITCDLHSQEHKTSAVGGKSNEILSGLPGVEGAAVLTCKQDWPLSLSKPSFLPEWGDKAMNANAQRAGHCLRSYFWRLSKQTWFSDLTSCFSDLLCTFVGLSRLETSSHGLPSVLLIKEQETIVLK